MQSSDRALQAAKANTGQMLAFISDIARAASEQSLGVSQVHQALNQLEQVTQQNAGLVASAASASQMLDHQSETMATLVDRFVVAWCLGERCAQASFPRQCGFSSPTDAYETPLRISGYPCRHPADGVYLCVAASRAHTGAATGAKLVQRFHLLDLNQLYTLLYCLWFCCSVALSSLCCALSGGAGSLSENIYPALSVWRQG